MIKPVLQASLIILLILGFSVNVYPCITPAAPGNTTKSDKLSICDGMNTKLSAKGTGTLGWYSTATGGTYLGNDTNFTTPVLSKTTTFYVQDSTCEASTSRTAITVIVMPHAKADFSVKEICEGDTATFINLSQNAQTYVWKFGDGENSRQFSPKHFYNTVGKIIEVLNVTLVAVDSNGCSDSINQPFSINAIPKSDFSFTRNQNFFNFQAKQPNNSFYRWHFGNGDSSLITNPTYSFFNPGVYTVCLKVVNAARCFSETCKEVSVISGISQTVKPSGFKIYPSPNTGNFTIEKETDEISSIEIVDQIGQIIHKAELNEFSNPINLDLVNGIYLIRATNGENSLNQRMVVSK